MQVRFRCRASASPRRLAGPGTCPVRFEGSEGWVETGDSGQTSVSTDALRATLPAPSAERGTSPRFHVRDSSTASSHVPCPLPRGRRRSISYRLSRGGNCLDTGSQADSIRPRKSSLATMRRTVCGPGRCGNPGQCKAWSISFLAFYWRPLSPCYVFTSPWCCSSLLTHGSPARTILAQDDVLAEPDAAKLVRVLEADGPTHAKAMACRRLALIGDQDAVLALAKLLSDRQLATYARSALEAIPDAEAGLPCVRLSRGWMAISGRCDKFYRSATR